MYRKLVVASLIIAMLLASMPVAGVLAAPPTQQGGGGNNGQSNGLEESWGNKLRQLQAEVTFFNNFQTKPGQYRNPESVGQYLDQWRSALAAAQSLVVSGSGFDSNGQITNQNQAKQSNQLLGQYLSTIRGMKDKIGQGGGDNNNGNNNTGGGNTAGIPVTGGAANNNNQGSSQNSSPAKTWGSQFRELQAAQAWFNNYHPKPGKDRNSEHISQYLDQYASALRAAYAIIANGAPNSNVQSTSSDGQSITNRNTGQQQLAMYLSMMRGLRQKIAEGGGDNNNNNNGNNNTGGG